MTEPVTVLVLASDEDAVKRVIGAMPEVLVSVEALRKCNDTGLTPGAVGRLCDALDAIARARLVTLEPGPQPCAPLPWRAEGDVIYDGCGESGGHRLIDGTSLGDPRDAAYIVAACNEYHALKAEIQRLREELERCQK